MEALSIDTWPARIAELFLGKWKLLVYVRNNVPAKLFFLLVFLDLKMAVTRTKHLQLKVFAMQAKRHS